MRHIQSKAHFYELSRRLLLGNRLEQWTSREFVERFRIGTLPPVVGMRHVATAFTKRGASRLISGKQAYWIALGENEKIRFDTAAPHDHLTFQGEVAATERGLDLRYSYMQIHQQRLWELDAPGAVQYATGLRASALLQKYMDPPSWDKLNEILSCQLDGDAELNFTYPIVEFSCFDIPVGVLGWNTLVWEVRTRY